MNKKKIKTNKLGPARTRYCEGGFTLIETFVAVTILVFAIMGPLQMFSQAITDSTFAKYQIIGFYLASEGLDVVVNKKDNNVRSKAAEWLGGLPPASGSNDVDPLAEIGGIIFDNGECDNNTANHGCTIYTDSNGYYRPAWAVGGATDKKRTPFRRQVKVEEIGSGGDQAKVTSTVWWNYKGKWKQTNLSTYISNI